MVASLDDLARLPDWPRRMSRVQAAAYVGLSPTTFDERVKAGIYPQAIKIGDRAVWDRRLLDQALDREAGLGGTSEGPVDDVDPFLAGLENAPRVRSSRR